jgi:iron complex outermembrane receptor protein
MQMKIVSRARLLIATVLDAAGIFSYRSAGAQIALACASATIISLSAPTGAHAQGAVQNSASTTASASSGDEELQEIIVTGTHDPRATASASLSPISVVSASQLAATGAPDLMDMLVDVSPSIERVTLVPSYANGVDKITMRGLPSDNTLVMINGTRRHTTATIDDGGGPEEGQAPTDLGLFPSSAIDHIEVLLDGASALYGSDAIAGVANIILKKNDSGMEFSTNNGIYSAGDGFTSDTTGNWGFKLGGSGFLSLSAEYLHEDHTYRSNPDERSGPPPTTINKYFGNPSQDKETVAYNAGIDLSDTLQLYSFSTFAHRVSNTYQYWRPPSKLPQIYPDGFEPQTAGTENDYATTVGLKGTVWGWDWNLSGTYGYDHTGFFTSDTANIALYDDTGSTPTAVHNGGYGDSETTAQLDIRRSYEVGLAGPLVLAFGGQYRYDTYDEDAGEPASYYGGGTQGSGGFDPAIAVHGAHHDITAGYIDLALEPIDHLKADLAGRYESYSDSGSKPTGKVSLRYDFTPAVAVRGTASTGFRAPTLPEQYFSTIAVTPTGDNGQLAVSSPGARSLGAVPLKPETSTNYSVGLVLHPVERMSATIDAYQISIKNRIVVGGNVNGQAAINAYALEGLGTNPGVDPSAVFAQYFTNGADTRTQGLEIASNYNTPFETFKIDWNAAANFSHTIVQRIADDANGDPLLNAQQVSFFTTAYPAYKVTFGPNLTAGKFSVNLHEILWGPTTTLQQYAAGPNANSETVFYTQHNQPKWQTDLQFNYEMTHSARLFIGATDLFNATPTKLPLDVSFAGVYKYDYYSEQIGINGAYYYAGINISL